MKIADIAKVIEAVLFVSGDGVDRDEFKRIYDMSDKELNKCLDILRERYNENTGVNIITYKNKIQLCSNPELADSIAEILNPIRERSLTKAALETIAIIAYKQPITRAEIEQIRGVNCDYAVQLLQNNNLIEVVGRKDAVGKPLLFGTTDNFLKRFELDSIEALPNHKELLDRIRVIHSEGDSLYREFSIPDEDATEQGVDAQGDQPLEDTQPSQEPTTETANEIKSVETIQQPVERDDIKTKAEIAESASAEIKAEAVESASVETKVAENANNEVLTAKNAEIVDKIETKKLKKRKSLIEALEDHDETKKIEQTNIEQNNTTETAHTTNNDATGELAPKLSWRDKMRAKMNENAGHYENLDNVLERKQNN